MNNFMWLFVGLVIVMGFSFAFWGKLMLDEFDEIKTMIENKEN